jgi:CheY-like chemotaxis protein
LGMFQIILQSIGYEKILSARNGVEALPVLQSHGNSIDLILLNWLMPKMDGITLLRLLAQEYPHPVGVLMESGFSDDRHIREFFNSGSDLVLPIDYVAKPFVFEEFKLEVRVAMQIVGKLKRRTS